MTKGWIKVLCENCIKKEKGNDYKEYWKLSN